jgi:ADP-heptose:LPS heptosyltransferase
VALKTEPHKVYNACGKFNLSESADLVKRAKVIVTNDTGLMHIAAAFQKPIISLWGNTTPALGMFPYYGYNNLNLNVAPLSYIAEVRDLNCRPCSKIGYTQCPKQHFKCMENIDITAIVKQVEHFWKYSKTKTS